MPKNIVATPAAAVAVDRLTLQAGDARGDVLAAPAYSVCHSGAVPCVWVCFSDE